MSISTLFQGDEIGMTNLQLRSIAESKDIETQTGWREAQQRGLSEGDFLKVANQSGRDNARTSMQWSDSPQARFSNTTPWMGINPNTNYIHVEAQQSDPYSILNYFRRMVQVRKAHAALVYGAFKPFDTHHEKLFTYYRILEQEKYLIVLNFSDEKINLSSEILSTGSHRIIGNYEQTESGMVLPWEANLFKL